MVNNAIPDSIITNMICRYLASPPVDSEEPSEVSSTDSSSAALISKNTLRILKTIKPVTRVFTAKDRIKLVGITTYSQILVCDNCKLNGAILAIGSWELDIGVSGYCHMHVVFRYFQPPTVVALADANQVA